ncbi:phytoene desaturase [Methanothermobacter sp. KEPCO-1]|uniref:phytoene desaturase family protein n=1 Tax=Methanothermobacter sp. KEPCO-1 TaxID=2603820 RepID=UPI0011CB84D6|nr:phytoene desaturase family protein [Methanothermobacter sp. KEPCO-1]QEF94157.1 phytoene desaturase [Methanothermobacter sp. KEPCO-1]
MRIVIVGAGFGGLSAAALLARGGMDVTVIEKNEGPGGRASVYSEGGFTFDMGPSWYLMPDIFENFFAEFRRKPEDFYSLKQLDPAYRVFFDDDKVVNVSSDIERNYELFDSFEENGGEKLREYLHSAGELYDSVVKEMLYRDYRSILDFLNGKLLLQGIRLNILESLEHFVNKRFESDEARKILQYSIGFLGSAPQDTPSMYHIMSHIDMTLGVFYPEGGIRRVAESIYELALDNGAEFHFNEEVKRIEVTDKMATSVVTDRNIHDADAVLVNADYPHSELELLDADHRTYDENYWNSRVLAPSAFVAYVGVDRTVDALDHHNLFLERDWADKFQQVFDPEKASWPERPSYYVNVPSRTDKTAAPEGSDTLFILVPLAPGMEDNQELREGLYSRVMDDLEGRTGMKIRDHVVVKRIFAINDFRERYNAYRGTALGLSHTLRQTALWRPAHKSKKVKNLYYTGQYTHPGIGVPMTLISSQIVCREILEEMGE